MNNNTSKIYQDQIDGSIVNSIRGPSVDNTDPKNPIIPEIPSVVDLVNKANKDGSNTIGGIWQIDYIMSEVLPINKNVIRVFATNLIEYGSDSLKNHVFAVDNQQGLKVRISGEIGQIWHSFNFNPNDYYTKNEVGDIETIPNWSEELENSTNF